MFERIAFHVVVLVHFAFLAFVVVGGFAAIRWRALCWPHLVAVAWGVWIEVSGGVCPLTPLENHYARLAGAAGYEGSFIEHYLLPVLYPPGLTREVQLVLAGGLVGVNLVAYALARRRWQRSPPAGPDQESSPAS